MSGRILQAAAFALVAAAVPAQGGVEREPNNRPTEAQRLAVGERVAARLDSTADTDWFRFSLRQPQRVSLCAAPASTSLPWAPSDTLVAIYDAAGERRLAWNERNGSGLSDCGVTLPAGDYACLVALQPTGSPGYYVLEFDVQPPHPIDVTERAEPNDNPAAGGAPTPIRLGDTVAGEITPAGDVDWFTFDLARPGIVQAVCLDDGGVPQLDSTRLQLWRETSPGVWSARTMPSFTRGSHRVLDLSHTTHLPAANLLPAGRYAIQVDADLPTPTGTAPWDYRRVGHYALRTALIDLPGTTIVGERAEPNDDLARATPLQPDDDATGCIVEPGDADWYRLDVGAPMTLGATAEGHGNTAVAVTSIRLCDANGHTLASGTGTSSAHGKLVHTIAEPGVYFLEVKGRLFTDTGCYLLHTGGTTPTCVEAPRRTPRTRAAEASAPTVSTTTDDTGSARSD